MMAPKFLIFSFVYCPATILLFLSTVHCFNSLLVVKCFTALNLLNVDAGHRFLFCILTGDALQFASTVMKCFRVTHI